METPEVTIETSIRPVTLNDVIGLDRYEKVRDELQLWRDTCITTMLVSGPPFLLEQVADIVRS